MMSYSTTRFVTLACIISMLFGAYLGLPCHKVDHNEGSEEIREVNLDASPSGHLESNTQIVTPLRELRPVPGGLDRRMMMPKKGGGGMPKPPPGGGE